MINFCIHWHPQFLIDTVDQCGAIFIAEHEQYRLPEEEYQSLDAIIQQQYPVSDYILSLIHI